MTARVCSDRGAATIELVVLTPVLLTMLLLVVFLGRITSARADVDEAARDAARAASVARTSVAASTDGEAAARASIDNGGPSCRMLSVQVDTAGFGPGGTVSASVACRVELSDLGPLDLPGTTTLFSTFVEPVDRYRSAT